jgi:hypothetical protein
LKTGPVGFLLDCVDRNGVKPSDASAFDPTALVSGIVSALAFIGSLPGNPIVAFFDLNENAVAVLKYTILAIAVLGAAFVVARKTTTTDTGPVRSTTTTSYAFPQSTRWIARILVVALLALFALRFVPAPVAPIDCRLSATIVIAPASSGATPLILNLDAGTTQQFPIVAGQKIALRIPATHAADWKLEIVWADGSHSTFPAQTACAPATVRSSDAKAEITLAKD